MAGQADRAAAEADLILLIVDAQAGVTEEDAMLAKRLRRSTVPVLVVANKVDGDREEADVAALYALGLGEPVPVSALHGRGAGDLLDRVVALLPAGLPDDGSDDEDTAETEIRAGRPPQRRQVVDLQRPRRRGTIRRVSRGRHHARQRRRRARVAGRSRALRGHRRDAPADTRERRRVLRVPPRDAGDRARRRRRRGDRGARGVHVRGQEDRRSRARGRSRVADRREQVGSGRGEGSDVQGVVRRGGAVRERHDHAHIGRRGVRVCTDCLHS